MTHTLPKRDDERFEEVLGRLDALVRRGQPEREPPPPPVVSEASIPVLTEVYQPLPAATEQHPDVGQPPLSGEERLERAVSAVLPLMTGIVEDVLAQTVRPAMDHALNQAIAELRPQIEALLRQRLQQTLEDSQTEM